MHAVPSHNILPRQHQYAQHLRSHSGPLPAKRSRGNTVITHYPPPPGYAGPTTTPIPPQHPHSAFQPQLASTFTYGHPSYANYSQPPYVGSRSFQPTPPPQLQASLQPLASPLWNGHYQTHVPRVFPSISHSHAATPTYAPPQPSWHEQFMQPAHASEERRDSPHDETKAGPVVVDLERPSSNFGRSDLSHADSPADVSLTDEDLGSDFWGECYFAAHPEELDLRFSIGVATYQPAIPKRLALPATAKEADLHDICPRKTPPIDETSPSEFFFVFNRNEALISVRQTERWAEVKNDLIFKSFPITTRDVIPIAEVLAIYRDRRDDTWTAPDSLYSPTPTPEPESRSMKRVKANVHSKDLRKDSGSVCIGALDVDDDRLEDLEHFIANSKRARSYSTTSSRAHSRASSRSSFSGHKDRPAIIRDKKQEDTLAALGVTGSPKRVYDTPGPALGSTLLRNDESDRRHSRHNSFSNRLSLNHSQPPLLPLHSVEEYDPWHPGLVHINGHATARRPSNTSQHTAEGSDFHMDDPDATPRPTREEAAQSQHRKRHLEDSDDNASGARQRDEGDDADTPRAAKQRRMEPLVADVYRRRW